jgi:cyclase
MRSPCLLLMATLAAAQLPAETSTIRSTTEVAEGVHVIRHRPAFGMGQGNTTVIVGQRAVLVVDTAIAGVSAREDIAQIRKWTDKPVAYLLNTHWHGDHNFANGAYMKAFPGLTILAHAETKKDMDLINAHSIGRSLATLEQKKAALLSGKNEQGVPLTETERAEAQQAITQMEAFLPDRQAMGYQGPTLAFTGDLTLDLGEREVQIRFLGRGNTSGDAVAWLPKEKVLVTGDLLVRPLPYTYDGYPSEWVVALERMAALGPAALVPGHGDVMRDTTFLLLVRDLFRSALAQLDEQIKRQGPAEFLTLDQVKDKIDLSSFRDRFAGDDPDLREAYDGFAARVVKLVFTEAALR